MVMRQMRRTFHHIYKTLESNSVYDLYDYLSNKTRPMIAFAQGFTIRKSIEENLKIFSMIVNQLLILLTAGK